ncbi:MAG: sulfatase [Bacteroidetes bacterium RBG_19FT_COMBO_42_10]|nr:MAG: sulfatase [Bacteroidetes bacterium RBG_19FT_COMBO_42_10]
MGLTIVSSFAFQASRTQNPGSLPNILWIVSEDNSAYFTGCYGNSFATTPNIDRLAGEGFLYTHAYCPNAVSSPTRNAIITGAYAASNGNENMRSEYPLPRSVHTYPEYLRKAGYYCTNNSKTDYNTPSINPAEIWDESSSRAHYKNRPEGKPFFAVFNIMTSHESSIHTPIPAEKLRHDPSKVVLPPYHPDTPEMRHDWAQYYDKIEDMDARVGQLLRELEESGLAENTIVMYYGDNGGVLARSKRYMYETGTQIPFIIRIPEKYKYLFPADKPGDKVDRLINFVDLAPTLLSIAGIPVPDYMQGKAFLGDQKTADPEYVYMTRLRMDERYDHVRAVRDKRYRYIRNYMPFRITMQHVDYLFNAPSAQSWEKAYKEGKTDAVQSKFFQEKPVEELYDTENDPWEINNLAGDPRYKSVLLRMRKVETTWMNEIRDVGLIPETEYGIFTGEGSMYDYMHSSACPFKDLMKASGLAVFGKAKDLNKFISYLRNDNSAIRYWGVTGLLILKNDAEPAINALKEASEDESGAVATLAAEALYGLDEKDAAVSTYINILQDTITYKMTDRNFALNSIDAIGVNNPEIAAAVKKLFIEQSAKATGFAARYSLYDVLMAEYLMKKWGVN